jgi:hypothetical protein
MDYSAAACVTHARVYAYSNQLQTVLDLRRLALRSANPRLRVSSECELAHRESIPNKNEHMRTKTETD